MRRLNGSLPFLAQSLHTHRDLVYRLVAREFTQRFRGSVLGVLWAVLTPLFTATAMAFVFSQVFKARWSAEIGDGTFDFALMLLAGTAIHGLFAESISRAPTLIVNNASYVTKVVFPLEILPVVALITGLLNTGIALAIVVLGNLMLKGTFPLTTVFIPLVILPYLIFLVAVLMFFAACGVYLRDLSHLVSLLVTLSLFLTPIFYPIEAVPPSFRPLMYLNPLTFVVEQSRAVLLIGRWPDFAGLAIYSLAAVLALAATFWLFQRLRSGFADVL